MFELETSEGGVRIPFGSCSLFMELPGGPVPGILDGFLTSLLGLYDLFVETGQRSVGQLFAEGIEGLKCALPYWNYRNKWSWYGSHADLCPPAYHCQNRMLLSILSRLSSDPCLAQYADWWTTDHLSRTDRIEIYLNFLVTKNVCRMRHRTWLPRSTATRQAESVSQQSPEPLPESCGIAVRQ